MEQALLFEAIAKLTSPNLGCDVKPSKEVGLRKRRPKKHRIKRGSLISGRSKNIRVGSLLRVLANITESRESRRKGDSIIDSDIENINQIFLQNHQVMKALEIWKVGKLLGVIYDGKKHDVIVKIELIEQRDKAGWLKLNTNSSVYNSSKFGAGDLLRDYMGQRKGGFRSSDA
ncbi:hypothetical protein Ancab_010812 [Ancistrocladus abbreviatus]